MKLSASWEEKGTHNKKGSFPTLRRLEEGKGSKEKIVKVSADLSIVPAIFGGILSIMLAPLFTHFSQSSASSFQDKKVENFLNAVEKRLAYTKELSESEVKEMTKEKGLHYNKPLESVLKARGIKKKSQGLFREAMYVREV